MRVLLKRTWFSPRGRRFRKSIPVSHPVEVPDDLLDSLPSDAVVVEEDYVEPEPSKEPETLSEAAKRYGADPERASAEAAGEAIEDAEADRRKNAADFQAELAAEEGDKPKGGFKRVRGRPRKS